MPRDIAVNLIMSHQLMIIISSFKAGMPQKDLDISAKYLFKYFENARVFIVWPTVSKKLSIIEKNQECFL